ncbi:MAG TPA: nuclear transport factor 2 family protein [Mucilaginibacter sp.]|jgi:ketosteroid isomerase-like protein|nr:nuclear transport factor 2 family protein [Mucilaginibacter sp.]
MKFNRFVLVCVFVFLSIGRTSADNVQLQKTSDWLRVQALNKKIETDLIKGNVTALTGLYSPDCRYLPEFSPTVFGRKHLKSFFDHWLNAGRVLTYSKSSHEVQQIGDYLLETGNFNIQYTVGKGDSRNYRGKYMTIWKRGNGGSLLVLAEAFGADHQVTPEDMPYPAGDVKENQQETFIVSAQLLPRLEAYDKMVVHSVLTGDGEARAAGFAPDGIYLPHFDPMQIGMAAIRPYMLKTYSPNTISYVRDTYRQFFDSGNFILLTGHFKVILNNANKSGFEGNMLNLMKRYGDGKLLMYRQLAHN